MDTATLTITGQVVTGSTRVLPRHELANFDLTCSTTDAPGVPLALVRVTVRGREYERFSAMAQRGIVDGKRVTVTGRFRPHESERGLYRLDVEAWEVRIDGHGIGHGSTSSKQKGE